MMVSIESTYENVPAVATGSMAQASGRVAASTATQEDSVQLIALAGILNAFETDSRRNIGRNNQLHEMLRSDRYRVDSELLSKRLVQDMLNER
jgi:hypothetical protein